jgi:hypothetical protein
MEVRPPPIDSPGKRQRVDPPPDVTADRRPGTVLAIMRIACSEMPGQVLAYFETETPKS